jgi:hypothetical protein
MYLSASLSQTSRHDEMPPDGRLNADLVEEDPVSHLGVLAKPVAGGGDSGSKRKLKIAG